MADRTSVGTCVDAVRALLAGRWEDWAGLTADCSLASLALSFGGSSELDSRAVLGTATECVRATLGNAPVVVWHLGGKPLLVECDLTSAPLAAPKIDDSRVFRLDVVWGASILEGGEIVIPDRGLAVLVVAGGNAVACRGFEPMPMEQYLATRRPQASLLRPQPQPRRKSMP